MNTKQFQCLLCKHEAPPNTFVNTANNKLMCPRCRSEFENPYAYKANVSYADCDSQKAVTRFPFSLNNEQASISVRPGYIALLIGNDGQKYWLNAADNVLKRKLTGCQLYYICLSPVVMWGTSCLNIFGAYGRAQLSLDAEYVQQLCENEGSVMHLENHLRNLVNTHITKHFLEESTQQRIFLYRSAENYTYMLGNITKGVQLTKLQPYGYCMNRSSFNSFFIEDRQETPEKESASSLPKEIPPVDIIAKRIKAHTVKTKTEEVFISKLNRYERYKAGEIITEDMLVNTKTIHRYQKKHFSFSHGWGIYNQTIPEIPYFSANGTLSFYIDNTIRLSKHLCKLETWHSFEELFFSEVLKAELIDALKNIIRHYLQENRLNIHDVSASLSAMSVDLTRELNGEFLFQGTPSFQKYGLRVDCADILDLDIYSNRR